MPRYVITFIGDDRTGIVEQLAATISQNGGNWLESRVSQLGGKFAGIILIELDGSASALESALQKLPAGAWSAFVTPADGTPLEQEANITLGLVGPDRVGIVHEISSALAQAGISVVSMDTALDNAAFTGEPLFRATLKAYAPASLSRELWADRLFAIGDAMGLDIDLDDPI